MWNCKEGCYRHYYDTQPTISLRHAAWIVNGYDPRTENPLYNNRNIDANYRRIKRDFNCTSSDDLINTVDFFVWAMDKLPDFKSALPIDLVTGNASATLTLPTFSTYSFALPDDPAELRKCAVQSELERRRQDVHIKMLEQENEQLKVDSKWRENYRKQQTIRAKKSRER